MVNNLFNALGGNVDLSDISYQTTYLPKYYSSVNSWFQDATFDIDESRPLFAICAQFSVNKSDAGNLIIMTEPNKEYVGYDTTYTYKYTIENSKFKLFTKVTTKNVAYARIQVIQF